MHSLQTVAHGLDLNRQELDLLTPSAELDLTKRSSEPVPTSVALDVAVLMKQVRDAYPHQELDPGTARIYTAAWAALVMKHGAPLLAESLRQILDDEQRPNFFPALDEVRRTVTRIRGRCFAAEQDKLRREKEAEAKATWKRERDEDIANGIQRGADPRAEVDALIAGAVRPRPDGYSLDLRP